MFASFCSPCNAASSCCSLSISACCFSCVPFIAASNPLLLSSYCFSRDSCSCSCSHRAFCTFCCSSSCAFWETTFCNCSCRAVIYRWLTINCCLTWLTSVYCLPLAPFASASRASLLSNYYFNTCSDLCSRSHCDLYALLCSSSSSFRRMIFCSFSFSSPACPLFSDVAMKVTTFSASL